MPVEVAPKEVRQRLPEAHAEQEAFVCARLQEKGGVILYQKLNARRDLCEKFNVRKHDFQLLCVALNRLVEAGRVRREVKETRRMERYCGFVNPTSRQATLTLVVPHASS